MEEALRDLRSAIEEAVARFGMAGTVEIIERRVVLSGPTGAASHDLGSLPEQWPLLPTDERRRRINEIVRHLVAQRRASVAAPSARSGTSTFPTWLPASVIALALGVAAWAVYRAVAAKQARAVASAAATATAPNPAAERELRARRVCEATESRVMRGATVGATDVEGWVVDLVLLRDGPGDALEFDPGLTAFVDRRPGQSTGRIVWPPAKALTAIDQGLGQVQITDASLPTPANAKRRGVRLTFSGRYVVPYFREEERIDLIRLANALSERLAAKHGALFARCAHSSHPQLGSWFLGPDPAGAVASMIHWMGVDAAVAHVDPASLVTPDGGARDRAEVFDFIAGGTRALDRDNVLRLVGRHGGGLAGKEGASQTLTFPFKDGNRAGRASREIARHLGFGTNR